MRKSSEITIMRVNTDLNLMPYTIIIASRIENYIINIILQILRIKVGISNKNRYQNYN